MSVCSDQDLPDALMSQQENKNDNLYYKNIIISSDKKERKQKYLNL